MRHYTVYIQQTREYVVEVEADNREAAETAALGMSNQWAEVAANEPEVCDVEQQ